MNASIRVAARRTAVTVGVVGSLGLGAAAISAAAQWTAAAAPAAAPPVNPASLAGQLATEEARGSDLQSRLDAALAQAAELQRRSTRRTHGSGRTAHREGPQAQIVAAQKKLAVLNKQAAAAAAALAARKVTVVRNTAPQTAAPGPRPMTTTGASGAAGGGEVDDD